MIRRIDERRRLRGINVRIRVTTSGASTRPRLTVACIRAIQTLAWLLLAAGCGGSGAAPHDDKSVADAPSAPAFDLESNMNATVAALGAECRVLRKSLGDWSSIKDADLAQYWAAKVEQRRLADALNAVLLADPARARNICEWYDAVLRTPYMDAVTLRNRLSDGRDASADRNQLHQLMADAAGSGDAAVEYIRAMSNNPAEPANLHVLGLKMGYIKDDE
jgi:hypothetical protein